VTSPVSFESPAPAAPPPAPALTHPAALVDPLNGTGTGLVSRAQQGEFPGADVPFGMLEWSPDTSPDMVQSGGGYADDLRSPRSCSTSSRNPEWFCCWAQSPPLCRPASGA
jgi:putative alpha-1,2-mannosidase